MPGKPRLTKRSKAVRILRAKFEKGDLTRNEQPKAVWESEAIFQKHKLANFRTCYNSMRVEFGARSATDAGCDDNEDGRLLDRRCSAGEPSKSRRKRHFADVSVDETEESDPEDLDDGARAELVCGELNFKPLYNIPKWTKRTILAKQLCVAIILPSGVGSGDFTINVVDGGQCLQITVLWPQPLVDVLVMHRWKLANTQSGFMPYHPSVLGLEASLRDLRKRSSDALESIALIPLPFTVWSQIVSKGNLYFKEGEGTKMLYVQLKEAVVEEYGIVTDTDSFKEV